MIFRIKNKDRLLSLGNRQDRILIISALESAVGAVSPLNLLQRKLKFRNGLLTYVPTGESFDLSKFEKVVVIGAGKASGYLAQSIEKLLGPLNISAGYVNVLRGTRQLFKTRRIKINEASHPTPNGAGVNGTKHIVRLLSDLPPKSLVICLISGGGSSLLPLPTGDITLREKVRTTNLLLKAGANIDEINCVRKHISLVKGGQLVRHANSSARFLSLIVSDVVGDHLESIGSGPTCPDPTTFRDASNILSRYRLTNRFPPNVLAHIRAGVLGKVPETPKPGDRIFSKVSNQIIASNKDACAAAVRSLTKGGLHLVRYLGSSWRGEADPLAQNLAGLLCQGEFSRAARGPESFVWGGEATVTIRGKGKGGRNQEQALSAIEPIGRCSSRFATLAFFATDGVDGRTDAAGAIIDAASYSRSLKMKLDLAGFLQNNDSYNFFRTLGRSLIFSGPTGTNVNDIGIAIIRNPSQS